MVGDLHCHSTMSDGATPVDDVIIYAKRAGMDFISLTDHDTMAGVQRAVNLGKRQGLRVIPGLEITTRDSNTGRTAHLLCYMPIKLEKLEHMTAKTLISRKEQAEKLVSKIGERFPITMEDVVRASNGSSAIYRQHVMRALMEQGYSQAVFSDFFNEVVSKIPYEVELPETREAARLVRASGGVAALAHPGQYDSFELAAGLAEEGLIQAIELSHPRNNDECRKKIEKIIREYWLVPIGGSDFHGFYTSSPHPIGTCTTPGDALEALIKVREELNGRR